MLIIITTEDLRPNICRLPEERRPRRGGQPTITIINITMTTLTITVIANNNHFYSY